MRKHGGDDGVHQRGDATVFALPTYCENQFDRTRAAVKTIDHWSPRERLLEAKQKGYCGYESKFEKCRVRRDLLAFRRLLGRAAGHDPR